MEQPLSSAPVMHHPGLAYGRNEAEWHGISWSAVLGGAVVTASVSLILLALGAGLGLSAVSPWSGSGASTAAIGTSAILWLILMNIMAGALGGYLAGRWRQRWPGIHTDEVYFRDTAHGFLAWGIALVGTAAFLATAATVMVGAAVSSPAAGGGTAAEGRQFDPHAYYVDMLFRSAWSTPDTNGVGSHNEDGGAARVDVGRIFGKALAQGELPAADRTYAAQVIAGHTGLSQPAADTRLMDVFAMAQQGADTARQATAHSLLWIFLALLIGAFCASVAATVGGRQRDQVILV